MNKANIINLFSLHRRFSISALEERYHVPHNEMQAVVEELLEKGLLIRETETKYKYIPKSECFCSIYDMLKNVYMDTDIAQSDIALLAWDLEGEIESGDLNCIPNTVLDFWAVLLWCSEHGLDREDFDFDDSVDIDEVMSGEVDLDLAKEWDIFDGIIDILEVNEKNAHTLCQSFLDFNDYNAFVRLVTDFRDYLTDRELREIFKAARCFDKELVDCYRDD